MITRRIVLSRAALGAAALVSSVGLLGAPVLAENGNGNGNDPVLQRRRERRREPQGAPAGAPPEQPAQPEQLILPVRGHREPEARGWCRTSRDPAPSPCTADRARCACLLLRAGTSASMVVRSLRPTSSGWRLGWRRVRAGGPGCGVAPARTGAP